MPLYGEHSKHYELAFGAEYSAFRKVVDYLLSYDFRRCRLTREFMKEKMQRNKFAGEFSPSRLMHLSPSEPHADRIRTRHLDAPAVNPLEFN
jgi:hypothetical protein